MCFPRIEKTFRLLISSKLQDDFICGDICRRDLLFITQSAWKKDHMMQFVKMKNKFSVEFVNDLQLVLCEHVMECIVCDL